MELRIGEKIRSLRKARDLSQETLAQALDVSFQAVSRWENGAAMPDIAMLPALAAFFGVTMDELFDYNRLETQQRVEALCTQAAKLRGSDPAGAERLLREGLRQYPSNEILLNNLLYTLRSPERAEEVVSLCKTLIQAATLDEVKYDALRILAETYHEMGKQSLVEPTLERIPEIYFTKLELMAALLEGEAARDAACRQLHINLISSVELLRRLQEIGTPEERVQTRQVLQNILSALRVAVGPQEWETPFFEEAREALEL